MNEVMWAVLSEWDMINTEVKALVSNGLFLTNYETFMSCDCVRGGRGGGGRISRFRWVWSKGNEWWA